MVEHEGTDPDRVHLVPPDPALHTAWLSMLAGFTALGEYVFGSGLTPDGWLHRFSRGWYAADTVDPVAFGEFVAHLRGLADPATARSIGAVPDTKLWLVGPGALANGAGDGPALLGVLSVRHDLDEFLRTSGGHIGYAVHPGYRRQGLATLALRHGLSVARGLGVGSALVICDVDNDGSARTVERCGGVLEGIAGGRRRYWVPT